MCALVASPALADRGIAAPRVEQPQRTCAELLRSEIAEGRLRKDDEIGFRLTDGRSLEGRFMGVDHGSVFIAQVDDGDANVSTKYAIRGISEITVSRAHFRPAWMAWGFMVGGLLGVVLSDEDTSDATIQIIDSRVPGGILGAFGGAVLGSALSVVTPMTDTFACR